MRKSSKGGGQIRPVHLDFFSPAPIGTPSFYMDIAPVMLLNKFHSRITASWRAIAAPDHIHNIDRLPPELKKYSLPIVPNTDFLPARQGKGPEWHKYQRKFTELKFVATTGLSAFGIATYDKEIVSPEHLAGKKIGAAPRPSSLRVLKEAILRDAWGIEDKVILKDYSPHQTKDGLLSGDIDATFWVQNHLVVDGFECLTPQVLDTKDTHWVNLSVDNIGRINKNNSWKLHRVQVPSGSIRASGPKLDPPFDVGMAGFCTAICAWDSTEDTVVYELVKFLDTNAHLWPEYTNNSPLSLSRMARWPGLNEDMVHPGAINYYKERGIGISEPVELRRLR
ncbi:MAG: ABC transporter substrate-binding protein [Deltaproteobacteria bacterium]|nr:ABC transporter substrate-binding protein [Deltaproteobacteria bacterium]